MKRRMIRATVVMAILLAGVMGVSGLMGVMATSAEAGGNLEFGWNAGFGTPISATAAVSPSGLTNDQSFAVEGQGTLRIKAKGGKPKKVDGGGTFVHTTNMTDGVSVTGTWKAKKLLMFESYGPGDAAFIAEDPEVREAWRTGRALILVQLKYDDSGMKADAILEIGCRLPGNDGISGTIEGIRIVIDGGLNFNAAADPKDTVFVDLN